MHNGDKPLVMLKQQTLIEWVIERSKPQVENLLLSVNRNTHLYEHLNLPIFQDSTQTIAGPLVGIVSALQYLNSRQGINQGQYLACFPADVPSFPSDLVLKLELAIIDSEFDVVMANSLGQLQPLFSLWRIDTLPILRKAVEEGLYGPKMLLPRLNCGLVDFDTNNGGGLPFFTNINTPQDLLSAQKLIN